MNFYKYAGACMVSLLVLGNAYADGTIIASKAYVDSKVGDVDLSGKQDVLTTTNVTSSGSGNIVTGVTASNGTVTVTKSDTLKAGNTTNVTALTTRNTSTDVITSTGADTDIPSTALLVDVLQTIDGKNADGSTGVSAGGSASDANKGKAVVAVSQTDGRVTATLGTVGSNGIASSAVISAKIAANAVTSDKIAANAVTSAKIAAKNVQYATHMNNESLFDVNTGVAPATGVCIESNPCMLTYYKKDNKIFTRWTPLDTDGLSANVSVVSDGV